MEANSRFPIDDSTSAHEETDSEIIERLERELAKGKERTADLETRIRQNNAERHDLQRQKIETIESQAANTGNNIAFAELQDRYKNLEVLFANAINENKGLFEELKKADGRIESQWQELRVLRSRLREQEKRGDELENERDQLLRRIALLEKQLEERQTEVEEARKGLLRADESPSAKDSPLGVHGPQNSQRDSPTQSDNNETVEAIGDQDLPNKVEQLEQAQIAGLSDSAEQTLSQGNARSSASRTSKRSTGSKKKTMQRRAGAFDDILGRGTMEKIVSTSVSGKSKSK